MTVQEIFKTPAVEVVELEILNVVSDSFRHPHVRDTNVVVQHLLEVRKSILNQLFVLTPEYKQLLSDFNQALIMAQLKMRSQLLATRQAMQQTDLCEVEFVGKVFMSYKYPKTHPVQNMRAKKMWGVLSGSYDNYIPLYEDGVNMLHLWKDEEAPSEDELIYLGETCNWNEGLDRDKTEDMNLCYAFHALYEECEFSIFDFLWVRDFCIEVSCEETHYTGSPDRDNLNWEQADFYE